MSGKSNKKSSRAASSEKAKNHCEPVNYMAQTIVVPAESVVIGRNETSQEDIVLNFLQFQNVRSVAADKMQHAGIGKGDLVCFCLPNSPELLAGIMATWLLGAVAVPVDFRMTPSEILNICKSTGVKTLVTTTERLSDIAEAICDDARRKGSDIATTPASQASELTSFIDPSGWLPLSMGNRLIIRDIPNNFNYDAPALVILTSGTTGTPKGAVHSMNALFKNAAEMAERVQLKKGVRVVQPLPLSHIFGFDSALCALMVGGCLLFPKLDQIVETCKKYSADMIVGVPSIYQGLLSTKVPAEYLATVSSCMSGGAALSPAVSNDFHAKFGVRIIQGFGATETGVTAVNVDGPLESAGKALPSVTIKIVDDKDNVLPEGQKGEIVISGSTIMLGYLSMLINQDGKQSGDSKLQEYKTGDIGYLDADGYLYITGRMKEMINVGGNKVFPSEVESVLEKNSLVQEVAVVGKPHSKLGQIVAAIVVVADNDLSSALQSEDMQEKKAAEAQLKSMFREYVSNELKRELRPSLWIFRPNSQPLPKNRTGKVDKKTLAEQLAQ